MSVTSVARSAEPLGIGVGLAFWFASLTPTLVPRGWIVQGVVSGMCLAIGLGLGAVADKTVRHLSGRPRSGPGPGLRWPAAIAKASAVGVVGIVGAVAWATWQDEARDLVGMARLGWWEGAPMVALSVGVAAAAARIGAAIRRASGAMHRHVKRAAPAGLALPATVVLALVVGVGGGQVLMRAFALGANAVYETLDQGTNRGIGRPTLANVSGSPASLVAWESMGMWGRDFVAGVTSREQLLAYHGADAEVRDPVRVFVGMRAAATIDERAALAVDELERAGGFDRDVVAVWIPGGSGWMDPNAARALEQLHAGDTAIVAIQYSYLPSFFSLVIDSSQAIDAGATLFEAVHERWSRLPADERPRLIVFGASLGAGGAERPFVGSDAAASVANFASRADGALIVGSLGWNPIFRQLTEARDPGSPTWQPSYASGQTVRFLTGRSLPEADAAWGPSRMLYLQHPSDPVAYLSLGSLWSPLEWMDQPRGEGVPPDTGWFPIVSTLQALADLSFPASLPSGYGHDYRVDYADAFARVAPPEAWTAEDTARLEAYLAAETATAAGGR